MIFHNICTAAARLKNVVFRQPRIIRTDLLRELLQAPPSHSSPWQWHFGHVDSDCGGRWAMRGGCLLGEVKFLWSEHRIASNWERGQAMAAELFNLTSEEVSHLFAYQQIESLCDYELDSSASRETVCNHVRLFCDQVESGHIRGVRGYIPLRNLTPIDELLEAEQEPKIPIDAIGSEAQRDLTRV
jgi:hypothetical protein